MLTRERCKIRRIYCKGRAFNPKQASSLYSALIYAAGGAAGAREERGGEGSAYETRQCGFPAPSIAVGLLIIGAGVGRVRAYTLSHVPRYRRRDARHGELHAGRGDGLRASPSREPRPLCKRCATRRPARLAQQGAPTSPKSRYAPHNGAREAEGLGGGRQVSDSLCKAPSVPGGARGPSCSKGKPCTPPVQAETVPVPRTLCASTAAAASFLLPAAGSSQTSPSSTWSCERQVGSPA